MFTFDLLIGVDNFFSFVYASKLGPNLYSLPSKLGTIVACTIHADSFNNETLTTVLRVATNDMNLDTHLSKFWKLDSIGILQPKNEDENALKDFEDTITYENEKYTARLPWGNEHPKLPTNKNLAS